MMTKQAEIERLEQELVAAVKARTELKEQLEIQVTREANVGRHLEDLRGEVRPAGDPLSDRIVRMVEDVGSVGPKRCAELLMLDDPTVNAASVRALMGQLAKDGRLVKVGRGTYAPAEGVAAG